MFTRKRQHGYVTIEATFQWDGGDPSVGISAGWGEDTCVEITAPFVDGKLITWITWRDFTTRDDFPSLQDTVKHDDPSTWLIEDVQTEYRSASGLSTALAEWSSIKRTHRTLSTLPEVLEVVRDAWEDAMASERLSAARENVQMAEAWRDEQAHLAAEGEHAEVGEAEVALEQARRELGNAEVVAQNRGVVV